LRLDPVRPRGTLRALRNRLPRSISGLWKADLFTPASTSSSSSHRISWFSGTAGKSMPAHGFAVARSNIRTFVRLACMDDRCDLLCLDLPRAEALRRSAPQPTDLLAAAERAKALGDPTRLAVAVALRDGGELCVCDLAWVAERSDKLVSHHVRALRSAGLVRSRRDGKMVMYALTQDGASLLRSVLGAEVPA
jgi:DNA-binding transcriptional ArsR family regulator